MQIKEFFDKSTFTLSYILYDEKTLDGIVIDPVLDFDPASGKIETQSMDLLFEFIQSKKLNIGLILETHAHADHISASQILKRKIPQAKIAIGSRIGLVQEVFKGIYNLPQSFKTDGSQFDRLLYEGDKVQVGSLKFEVLFTPGHTPACASYLFDGCVFVGDTLFMPDYGTGRADFPGGSASDLYDSITKVLYRLPDNTRLFTGHDYQPGGRELRYEASIAEQKKTNIQLNSNTTKEAFLKFRQDRDKGLAAPRLLHPSVQININAAHLPQPESNGKSYVKIPLILPKK